jgi:hypothetical protein
VLMYALAYLTLPYPVDLSHIHYCSQRLHKLSQLTASSLGKYLGAFSTPSSTP